MTRDPDAAFLLDAARYFERRPTGGEDRAHWANVYNAENCRRIAARLASVDTHPKGGDAVAAPFMSGAVGAEGAETPTPPPESHP